MSDEPRTRYGFRIPSGLWLAAIDSLGTPVMTDDVSRALTFEAPIGVLATVFRGEFVAIDSPQAAVVDRALDGPHRYAVTEVTLQAQRLMSAATRPTEEWLVEVHACAALIDRVFRDWYAERPENTR